MTANDPLCPCVGSLGTFRPITGSNVHIAIGKVHAKAKTARVDNEELPGVLLRYLKAPLIYPERPLASEVGCR